MVHTLTIKNKAIELRRKGFSYSEILKQIPVAKSTLSSWLKSVGLSKNQKQRLTEKKLKAMQRGAEARRQQRIDITEKIKKSAREEVRKLINDPFWLTGVILYWAEGAKEKEWAKSIQIKFSNMDLEMHRIFKKWAKKYLNVSENQLRYELYIHEKANIEKSKKFWIENLNIPSHIGLRIYLKKHNPKTLRKNQFEQYNGVVRICINESVFLNRKIAGWIEGVINYF